MSIDIIFFAESAGCAKIVFTFLLWKCIKKPTLKFQSKKLLEIAKMNFQFNVMITKLNLFV